MARKITKELPPEEMLFPSGGKNRKIICFDFPPGASPEEIAKALNEMVKKYRKGREPENPAKEDSSAKKP